MRRTSHQVPKLLLSEALGAPGSHQRTWISCYAAPDRTACAAFIKESRMEVDNATNLDRKSGVPGLIMVCFHCFHEGCNRLTPAVTIAKAMEGLRPIFSSHVR